MRGLSLPGCRDSSLYRVCHRRSGGCGRKEIADGIMTVTQARVDQIISSFAGKRILVLGDIMLDEFIWGKVRRISPEAPVPVVEVARETSHLGGAGNVVANLSALGAVPLPLGIVGEDTAGGRPADLLLQRGNAVARLFS